MDIRRKIGQLIVAGFEGTTVTEEVKTLITKYHVGNIILFERNCKTPKQVFELVSELQKIAIESNGVPLFIAIDQENGMVARLYQGVTHFPGNMAQAAASNPEDSFLIGKYTGEGLKTLGINFNLAPSLDVNNNPKNPVIGVRSFGDSPEKVAGFGESAIRGMQEAGIIATAKHFPGHGDTEVDSHLGLPTVAHDKHRLHSVELYPFKRAIEAGVKAIMTAHILFPALEGDKLPATLSKRILTNLLREELGYKGLIITDCMEMKAIDNNYTTEEAVPLAVKAGADLICISHSFNKQISSINNIYEKLQQGELTMAMLEDRVNRILKAKEELGTNYHINASFQDIQPYLDLKEHQQLAHRVSEKSLTLVKNEGLLPFKGNKVLVISPIPRAITGAEGDSEEINFGKYLMEQYKEKEVSYIDIELNPSEEEISEAAARAAEQDMVIICTINAGSYKNQMALVKEVMHHNKNILLVPMRNPYDYLELKEVRACVLTYEYTKNSMRSLARLIKSEISAEGKLPIALA